MTEELEQEIKAVIVKCGWDCCFPNTVQFMIDQEHALDLAKFKECLRRRAWFNNENIYNHMSEDFIRHFKEPLSWSLVGLFSKLSEEFIIEFENELDWLTIGSHQKLSEKFMEQHMHKLNWMNLCSNQILSDNFIKKHFDKIVAHKQNTTNLLYNYKIKIKEPLLTELINMSEDPPFFKKRMTL